MTESIAMIRRGMASSSETTEEIKTFFRTFKKEFSFILACFQAAGSFTASRGHFYVSGFFQKGQQIWYFSLPDLRDAGLDQMLIRKASSFTDYTGGDNQYVSLSNLKNDLTKVIGGSTC